MKIKNFFHIILLALIIFFLAKVPRYENTLLQLSKNTKIERDYSIFNDDEALLILDSTNLEDNLYIKELKKLDNMWLGNTYTFDEAYKKNSGFKWLEDDSEEYNPKYISIIFLKKINLFTTLAVVVFSFSNLSES